MKKFLLLMMLCGCDPQPAPPTDHVGDWTLVTETPVFGISREGIYKRHDDKEHVTFYASRVHGGWCISAVKD